MKCNLTELVKILESFKRFEEYPEVREYFKQYGMLHLADQGIDIANEIKKRIAEFIDNR
jgi:hypothetical protein